LEPPGWVFVEKDNCMIMIGECPGAVSPRDLGDHSYFGYLRVDDADGYYQDLLTKGVKINSPIENKPWGMREFGVESPCSFGGPACVREKSVNGPMNPPNQSRAVVMVGRSICHSR
jgi:hypothetical protein